MIRCDSQVDGFEREFHIGHGTIEIESGGDSVDRLVPVDVP